ncbi:MAG: PfkB family carbohydrate kinase [Granulosicoccus sp.]
MPSILHIPPKLRIVGALHIDEVATVQGTFVAAASNPVAWQRYVGGVGSNAARAAQTIFNIKAAGNSVGFHAMLGDDNAAISLVDSLRGEGVQVVPQFAKDQATGRYSVVVDESGNMVLGLADVQLAEFLQAETILTSLNSELTSILLVDANLSPDCLQTLIQTACLSSIPVAALTVSPSKAERLLPWADKIDVLFCNRREAQALITHSNRLQASKQCEPASIQEMADALVELGFNDFVLTDSASPLMIRCQNAFTQVQVPPVTINHNVNGAGDTLAGASIAALTLGLPLEQAVSEYGLGLAADVLKGKRLPLPA